MAVGALVIVEIEKRGTMISEKRASKITAKHAAEHMVKIATERWKEEPFN